MDAVRAGGDAAASDLVRGRTLLGEFELTFCSDGTYLLDGGAMFGVVPKPLWQKRMAADDQNRITRVSDVARVDLGAQNYTTNAYLGFKKGNRPMIEPAAAIGILQLPGTNALQAAAGVIQDLPPYEQAAE